MGEDLFSDEMITALILEMIRPRRAASEAPVSTGVSTEGLERGTLGQFLSLMSGQDPVRARAQHLFERRLGQLLVGGEVGAVTLDDILLSLGGRLEGGGTAMPVAQLRPEGQENFDDPEGINMLLEELLSQALTQAGTEEESARVVRDNSREPARNNIEFVGQLLRNLLLNEGMPARAR